MFETDTDSNIQQIRDSKTQQKILQEDLQKINKQNSFEFNFKEHKILVKVEKINDPYAIEVNYNGEIQNIRLIGCRIPIGNLEDVSDEFYAKNANDYLQSLVGSYLWIEKDSVLIDKYGAYWVYATKDDVSINKFMLENGLASFDTIEKGNNKMSSIFSEISKQAYLQKIGIWSEP